MTDLNWLEVDEIRLTSNLIPDPNSSSERLRILNGVRVAVEGPLLHIDPRSTSNGAKLNERDIYDVYVVPAAAVEVIRYRVDPSDPPVMVF